FYPKFHITCITHKKNAVYPSTIVGIPPQEDAWIGKATERIFLSPIKLTMLPEMVDMELPIEGVFHNLTIVQIKKEFSGHAQKVMNAMWGAGQMMFNKILIVTDSASHLNIHNYTDVAIYLSEHVDPATDIYLSQGPMDVLDHSCSKFAFGGKMCLDATEKTEEEKHVLHKKTDIPSIEVDENFLKIKYPEIDSMYTGLLKKGISVVTISIHKDKKDHVRTINEKLFSEYGLNKVKFIIYVDHTVNAWETDVVTWHFANNIDPRRDIFILPHNEHGISHAGIDGTRKTKALDDFDRPWPNIIVMDDKTIQAIDEKWEQFDIGKFIKSPSLKYKNQVYKGGAVAEE
ncbi:MAG: UbiD family decarboxylase, partial [Chitinophagales bacterium]|nr:UbiD family decarboxylase [Chitinophagales bacterium]